jgi:FemAB-related protein (PEP-CTERM system-associated)
MLIEELTSKTEEEWDRFVEAHPHSTCYHLRAWQRVADCAYGMDTPFLMAREVKDGPVVGVLPLFTVGRYLKRHISNGLFGAYAPILAQSDQVAHDLVEYAKHLLPRWKAHYLLIKSLDGVSVPPSEEFDRWDHWVIATLNLESSPDKMWLKLKDKTRNCIRKAHKSHLRVRTGKESLPYFYDVLAENMHSKGAPIYGYKFMRELAESLGDHSEVITLWQEDRAVAGAFLIHHHDCIYVPFASSRPSALSMSPNNLLYWEIIRRGCLEGKKVLDFGRSMKGSGTLKFKESWGAQVKPQPCFVYSEGHSLEFLTTDKWYAAFFVQQWQKVPLGIVNAIGPKICRQVAGMI